MIAYIEDNNKRTILFIKSYVQTYDNYEIYFNYDGHYVFVINDIKYNVVHEMHITYESIKVYFTSFSEEYNVFHKYSNTKGMITIGNNVENDIWIQDVNLKPLVIDNVNHLIKFNNHSEVYDDGYVLIYFNLRLTIHDDFIMCNSCKNIFINLLDINIVPTYKPLLVSKYQYNPSFKIYHYPAKLTIKINQPSMKPIYDPIPLKYMLLPSLMMALTSLINGILMTYNALLQQRTLLEVIPMLMMPMCMLLSSVLILPLQRRYETNKYRNKLLVRKNDFVEHLEGLKKQIVEYIKNVNLSLSERYLTMEELFTATTNFESVLWSKSTANKDYLCVALGMANITYDISINNITIDNKDELFPIYEEFKNNLNKAYGIVTIDLKKYKQIAIIQEEIKDYILEQLTSYFHISLLTLVFFVDQDYLSKHSYIRDIPHTNKEFRYIITNTKQLEKFNSLNHNNYVICFIQNHSLCPIIKDKMIIINIYNNDKEVTINNDIIIANNYFCDTKGNKIEYQFTYYEFNKEKYYLQLANCSHIDNRKNKLISLFEIIGIKDIKELNILKNYDKYHTYEDIQIILGIDKHNMPITLDLSEKAQGSHGLIAGSTGSGKSELLLSLITSLCVKYSYNELQFIIIDFKGAGLIQTFDNENFHLPHLVGSLSNLSNLEINRCLISLKQECEKRQRLFKQMSDIIGEASINIDKYQKFYNASYHLPYLSHLVIIVDEFAELKQQYSQFISQLISLSRIGRSLGIHLILATQKPSGIIDDQIWSNCHFYIALKVQSKQDSMDVIGTDEAYYLKNAGEFILACDGKNQKGKAGYGLVDEDYLINKNKVEILDETNDVIKSLIFNYENRVKQINVILDKIAKLNNNTQLLWQKPLMHIYSNEVIYYRLNGVLIGVVDNYYDNKQEYLYHQKKPLLAGIESIDKQKQFINMYLYNLCRIKNAYDCDVYIFDSNDIIDLKFAKNKMINIYRYEEETILNFYKFCAKSTKHKYLIITNLNLYLNKYPQVIDYLYDVLSNYEIYNISILTITNKPSMLYSKILLSFNYRITIGISDENELINVFNTSQIRNCDLNDACLVKLKNMLNFQMITINEDYSVLLDKQFNYEKKLIKTMPKTVYLSQYRDSNLTIGISYRDYEFYQITKFPILIISNSLKMLKHLKKIINMQNVECEINADTDHVGMYETSKYLSLMNKREYELNIWVGNGFNSQYIFTLNGVKDIKSNEAYIICEDNLERIKLIEK